jgi:DNA polymerase III delta prime subunit
MALEPEVRKYFEAIEQSEHPCIPHLLFYGQPGGGKSTLARILINSVVPCDSLIINASEESGVDTVREKILSFCRVRSMDGVLKIVLLEEADGLSNNSANGSSAQDSLKNVMEEYSGNVRFILTCNNIQHVAPALKSRAEMFFISPPKAEIAKYILRVLKKEDIKYDVNDVKTILDEYFPDGRQLVGVLQQCSTSGTLKLTELPTKAINAFVGTVLTTIRSVKPGKALFDTRQTILDHEGVFGSDYRVFLKTLFNLIFEAQIEDERKANLLLIVADSLVRHENVVDKEINAFGAVIQLCVALGA